VTGYVRTTDDDFMREFQKLKESARKRKLRGLVLDLRNNSGGLLNQGIRMADHFLPSGRTIVSVRNRNSADDEIHRSTGGDIVDLPLVVLVNDGSASAAEIVASALQDNERAIIIGDRTFGKASVQTLFSPMLQDDYYIKLTVARYYSPSGRTLQVTGVQPDVVAAPEFNGKMPLGFREENLSGHLVPIDGAYVSAMKARAAAAVACADAGGSAKKLVEADPNPAVKFDWQLMYGADILNCVIGQGTASVQFK
jgi:C-terminal peptidase prc